MVHCSAELSLCTPLRLRHTLGLLLSHAFWFLAINPFSARLLAQQPRDTERGEAATTGASDERQVPLAMRSCSWADRVSDDDEESECRSYPSSAKPARASPKAAAPAERAREGGSDEVVGNLPQVALKPIRHEERLGFGMDDIEEEWRCEDSFVSPSLIASPVESSVLASFDLNVLPCQRFI